MVPEVPIAMFPPPPVQIPMPVPIPRPIIRIMPIPVKVDQTTTTTTTTEQPNDCEGPDNPVYPQPVPFGVQVAISALRPPKFCMVKNRPVPCPPCPPCVCAPLCTPSFFSYCSPCHLKCRCREGMDVPTPIPPVAPFLVPGPAYPVPVGPMGLPHGSVIPYPFYPKISALLTQDKNDHESDESSSEEVDDNRSQKRYHKHFRRLKKLSKTRIPLNFISDHRHHKIEFSKHS